MIDCIHLELHGMEQCQRRNLRSNQNLRVHAHGVSERSERLRQHGFGQAVVQFVAYDADDEKSLFIAGSTKEKWWLFFELRQANRVSHCIPTGKVAAS